MNAKKAKLFRKLVRKSNPHIPWQDYIVKVVGQRLMNVGGSKTSYVPMRNIRLGDCQKRLVKQLKKELG